jgi:hypothetical protein
MRMSEVMISAHPLCMEVMKELSSGVRRTTVGMHCVARRQADSTAVVTPFDALSHQHTEEASYGRDLHHYPERCRHNQCCCCPRHLSPP